MNIPADENIEKAMVDWLRQTGHDGEIGKRPYFSYFSDGTKVLMGLEKWAAILCDAVTGAEIRTVLWDTPASVLSVAFSPDGGKVLIGADDKTARLWNPVTGEKIRTFAGHMDSVNDVVFSPDGTKLLTGSGDGTAKLWDAGTTQQILPTNHTCCSSGANDQVRRPQPK